MYSTDPIADMLSRIRNALMRGRVRVEIPHSRIKRQILEIFLQHRFIAGLKERRRGQTQAADRRARRRKAADFADHRHRAAEPARPARLRRLAADTPGQERPRPGRPLDQQGPDGWPGGPQSQSRRRGDLFDLLGVFEMSRVGKQPISVPAAVRIETKDSRVVVSGPKGSLSQQLLGGVSYRIEGGSCRLERLDDSRQHRGPARPDAQPDRQHGRRRHRGLQQEPRGRRHRLPRPLGGPAGWSSASASATRSEYELPEGIEAAVDGNLITVSGIDKQRGRPGGRLDPRPEASRALQGQGHPLPGRERPAQGRQGSQGGLGWPSVWN